MKLNIEHSTRYRYQGEVRRSTQYLRLTPKHSSRQRILSWELELPESATCTTDSFGNVLHVLTLDKPHEMLDIHARGVVEILDDGEDQDEQVSPLVFLRQSELTRPDGAISAFAREYQQEEAPLEGLTRMMTDLLDLMPYTPGSTGVEWNAAKALPRVRGSVRITPMSFSPAAGCWAFRRAM